MSCRANRGRIASFWPTVLMTLLVCLVAGNGMAEEQDIVGIYFDQQGLTTSIQTTEPIQAVYAWLVLVNISAESGIRGIGIYGAQEGTITSFCWWSLIGFQIDTCDPEWILAADPPLPWAHAMPVVKIGFMVSPLPPSSLSTGSMQFMKPTMACPELLSHYIRPQAPMTYPWQA